MTDVLSIDFDFWVPEDVRLDMGHQEAPFYIGPLWAIRVQPFLGRPNNLKEQLKLSETEVPSVADFASFIKPFVKKNAKVAVGESHASAFHEFEKLKNIRIVNLDAHNDCGYSKELDEIDCGNWIAHLVERGNVKSLIQIYPKWRLEKNYDGDNSSHFQETAEKWRKQGIDVQIYYGLDNLLKLAPQTAFSRIFLARSGAWVPPWTDDDFLDLVFDLVRMGRMTIYTYRQLDEFKRKIEEVA